jgi:hypothetical protein
MAFSEQFPAPSILTTFSPALHRISLRPTWGRSQIYPFIKNSRTRGTKDESPVDSVYHIGHLNES